MRAATGNIDNHPATLGSQEYSNNGANSDADEANVHVRARASIRSHGPTPLTMKKPICKQKWINSSRELSIFKILILWTNSLIIYSAGHRATVIICLQVVHSLVLNCNNMRHRIWILINRIHNPTKVSSREGPSKTVNFWPRYSITRFQRKIQIFTGLNQQMRIIKIFQGGQQLILLKLIQYWLIWTWGPCWKDMSTCLQQPLTKSLVQITIQRRWCLMKMTRQLK